MKITKLALLVCFLIAGEKTHANEKIEPIQSAKLAVSPGAFQHKV